MSSENSNWISEEYIDNLVSVIIPTYNRQDYIISAVQSVIDQTYRPIECIIVDDGSTDNTLAVLEGIKNDHPNFQIAILSQINSGSQKARNAGTKVAKGEYIQYLDSDDILYPGKIESQVVYLKRNPTIDAVFGDWNKGSVEIYNHVKAYESSDLVTQFIGDRCIHTFSFLFRRTCVNKIGEWNPEIKRNQEIDYQVRGVIKGCNFKYQENLTGLWRIHDQVSITGSTNIKEILSFYTSLISLLQNTHNLSEVRKKEIANNLFVYGCSDLAASFKYAVKSIRVADDLYKIPNLKTKKMKLLKSVFGKRFAISVWAFQVRRKNIRNSSNLKF